MSAQERETLAETLAREEWPDLTWSYIREHSDPERFYRRADALLAAGWTRPVPDGDAIERAAQAMYVEAHRSPAYRFRPSVWEDASYIAQDQYRSMARIAANLLASPVREPGRSEAEIKAEALEDARKIVADELAAEEARLLAFENPLTPMLTNYLGGIRVALDALDPYRADQVTDTEGTKP